MQSDDSMLTRSGNFLECRQQHDRIVRLSICSNRVNLRDSISGEQPVCRLDPRDSPARQETTHRTWNRGKDQYHPSWHGYLCRERKRERER